MLNSLPKKSLRVFGDGPINSQKTTFIRARKHLAHKLQNPRLLQISFTRSATGKRQHSITKQRTHTTSKSFWVTRA